MSFDESSPQTTSESEPEFISARARRRRAQRRAYFPTDEEGRATLYEHLTRRAFPSYELFVFSLVAGVILGMGYFFNTKALLFFGILVAPLLTPWVGMLLAIVSGSSRLFLQTFTALIISSILIFLSGALAGFVSRVLPISARTFTEAYNDSHLWWANLFVLMIAALILTISFVRSEERPYLPSALLASELLPPLCAAGFGLGSGVPEIWPQGILVFAVHLGLATLFGLLALFFLRFYPSSLNGTIFTGVTIVVILTATTFLTGLDRWIKIQTGLATPEPVPATQTAPLPTQFPTVTPSPKVSQATAVNASPTRTPTRTPTVAPRDTLPPTETSTVTAEPTPILGFVKASEGGGALVREKPNGKMITILSNGSSVTIVPNDIQDLNGVIWVHVNAVVNGERVDGWMIQSVLVTATPVPDWQPSSTPSPISTP